MGNCSWFTLPVNINRSWIIHENAPKSGLLRSGSLQSWQKHQTLHSYEAVFISKILFTVQIQLCLLVIQLCPFVIQLKIKRDLTGSRRLIWILWVISRECTKDKRLQNGFAKVELWLGWFVVILLKSPFVGPSGRYHDIFDADIVRSKKWSWRCSGAVAFEFRHINASSR